MTVRIKGFLTFRDVVGEQIYPLSAGEVQTLNHLLDWLSTQLGAEFTEMIFDPQTGSLSQHVSVLINGRHYTHLPNRLETQLKDGDEVSIFPPLAGGK